MTQQQLRAPRSDGQRTRDRLLAQALRLFAMRGYARTSTRAIAIAAHATIASISYHFQDKAGLYRAALLELTHWSDMHVKEFADPAIDLGAAVRLFYSRLFGVSASDSLSRCWSRLWMREMLEPSHLSGDAVQRAMRPMFNVIVAKLAADFPRNADQDDLARLALTILFLPMQGMSQSAGTTSQASLTECASTRLSEYADAIIFSEKRRCTTALHRVPMMR